MKNTIVAVALAFSTSALAAAPARLTREDALDLENVALKMDALKRDAATLLAHQAELLKKYDINPADLGRTVAIDSDGTVRRASPEKKVK
jgi:hypothetical protein